MGSDGLVPEQTQGSQSDTKASVEMDTVEHAIELYAVAKERLLEINSWHQLAGPGSAEFLLTDAHGNEVNRKVQIDDHFKIKLPGPGKAYDWVRVEAIEEKENAVSLRVRPCSDPENKKDGVAHFFNDAASSTFEVKRRDKEIIAAVHGRNEKPNTESAAVTDKIRNAAIALGAISGFAKLQWKSLVNGLVKND